LNYIYLFAALAAVTLLATLISLRRSRIRVEYSVSWLVAGCLLLGCALFPSGLLRIADALGLDPQICFVVFAGALALALLFEVSAVVSRLRDENVILTQRLAILEYRLQQLQSEHGNQSK